MTDHPDAITIPRERLAILAEILWMCAQMAPDTPAREGLVALEGFFDGQESQGGAFFTPDAERRRWIEALCRAVPVDQWPKVEDEPVLIHVEHPNLRFAGRDDRDDWRGWFVARWTSFNGGGWIWHGMLGTVTHVAPLPLIVSAKGENGDG